MSSDRTHRSRAAVAGVGVARATVARVDVARVDVARVDVDSSVGTVVQDFRSVSRESATGLDADQVRPPVPAGRGAGRSDSVEPHRRSRFRNLIEWVVVIGFALGIAFVVRTFVLAHFRVQGSSMQDTLQTGDRVFVNKLSYLIGEPHRGEVVILHESRSEDDLIKRIIGLPGETVEITGCEVYIDGHRLDEPYLSAEVKANKNWCSFGPAVVDEGTYMVFGDNRPYSLDSRAFGPVPASDIVGRAFVVVWPTSEARWL